MRSSSDEVLPGRRAPRRRRRSGAARRSRGKQPGAEGRRLGWVDVPDDTRCHRPAGRCACGADLAGAEDVRIERSQQVHDLPEIAVTVTQHDVWRVRCQVCLAHVIRDFEDAAECWPDAIWPRQAQRALRGLIRAWHAPATRGFPRSPLVCATR
ncbi:MAG: hypothetical protein LC721_07730 [Actinobacteria bacterium]|nr:hypothetical protein [Actinomycetota bacterium]